MKKALRLLPWIAALAAFLAFGVVQVGANNVIEAVIHPSSDGRSDIVQSASSRTNLEEGPSATEMETEETEMPEISRTPRPTGVEGSKTPEATHLPRLTRTPDLSRTPESTRMDDTEQPERTRFPKMSQTPEMSRTPEATEVDETEPPEMSETPHATRTPDAGQVVFITGSVMDMSGGTWTVRDYKISVDGNTQFYGNIVVGDIVRVIARFNLDGSYLALKISLVTGEGGEDGGEEGTHPTFTPMPTSQATMTPAPSTQPSMMPSPTVSYHHGGD